MLFITLVVMAIGLLTSALALSEILEPVDAEESPQPVQEVAEPRPKPVARVSSPPEWPYGKGFCYSFSGEEPQRRKRAG